MQNGRPLLSRGDLSGEEQGLEGLEEEFAEQREH